jgi:hypothetical protein
MTLKEDSQYDSSQVLPRVYDNEEKAIRTLPMGTGSILEGITFDSIEASYPNLTTEVYTYKLSSTTVATITIIYTDSTKDLISLVNKT